MSDPLTLGNTIKARREARGLSVRRAAALSDGAISEGRWRQIEKGYQQVSAGVQVPVHPTARTVRAIARVLGLDTAELLRLAGLPDTATAEDADVIASADNPVIAAILSDPHLIPEAQSHFLNQYRLLLRVSQQPDPAETEADEFDAQLDADLAAQPAADEVGRKRRKRHT